MTLSEWIADYCEDNNITLPDCIPDEETAIKMLIILKNNGGE